ncbi:MAG: FHA domain-containing protein [Myxococcota bacterium]|nr:FHA domain-containing protein [Myxococcota bacterium]
MGLVLRFVGGKFKGGEFPLKPNREIIIGRSSEFDMVLDEDMVSRQHAKINTFHGRATLIDLKSTNGTQVNGNNITELDLNPGDVISIGRSVMKLVDIGSAKPKAGLLSPATDGSRRPTKHTMQSTRIEGRFPEDGAKVSGLIKQLLKMRAPSTLTLTDSATGDEVALSAKGSRILRAELRVTGEYAPSTSGRKALFRAMTWRTGLFGFDPISDVAAIDTNVDDDLAQLIADARTQRAELESYRSQQPAFDALLDLKRPMAAKLSELSAETLETLQIVINERVVKTVVDKSDASDLETWQDILYLLENEYLQVGE